MNILALDTSMGACSAALLRSAAKEQRLISRHELMERGHAEALMPMVAEIMEQADTSFADLDLIAATVGPGSFTGVRIAIAAARGFALVTKAKLWGTDSLTVMTAEARAGDLTQGSDSAFAVAVDARRDMIYFGLFDGDGQRREGPLLLSPQDAVGLLPGDLRIVGGSGATLLAEAAKAHGHTIEPRALDLQPNAAALAELALLAHETVPVLRPLYLRPPDANPQAQMTARR